MIRVAVLFCSLTIVKSHSSRKLGEEKPSRGLSPTVIQEADEEIVKGPDKRGIAGGGMYQKTAPDGMKPDVDGEDDEYWDEGSDENGIQTYKYWITYSNGTSVKNCSLQEFESESNFSDWNNQLKWAQVWDGQHSTNFSSDQIHFIIDSSHRVKDPDPAHTLRNFSVIYSADSRVHEVPMEKFWEELGSSSDALEWLCIVNGSHSTNFTADQLNFLSFHVMHFDSEGGSLAHGNWRRSWKRHQNLVFITFSNGTHIRNCTFWEFLLGDPSSNRLEGYLAWIAVWNETHALNMTRDSLWQRGFNGFSSLDQFANASGQWFKMNFWYSRKGNDMYRFTTEGKWSNDRIALNVDSLVSNNWSRVEKYSENWLQESTHGFWLMVKRLFGRKRSVQKTFLSSSEESSEELGEKETIATRLRDGGLEKVFGFGGLFLHPFSGREQSQEWGSSKTKYNPGYGKPYGGMGPGSWKTGYSEEKQAKKKLISGPFWREKLKSYSGKSNMANGGGEGFFSGMRNSFSGRKGFKDSGGYGWKPQEMSPDSKMTYSVSSNRKRFPGKGLVAAAGMAGGLLAGLAGGAFVRQFKNDPSQYRQGIYYNIYMSFD